MGGRFLVRDLVTTVLRGGGSSVVHGAEQTALFSTWSSRDLARRDLSNACHASRDGGPCVRTYILRRLAHAIPVLLGVATVVFIALRLIPGDPAIALVGDKASQAEVERIRQDLGLNEPLPLQYVQFISHVATLQLGRSIRTGGDVTTELVTNFAPTIELSIAALVDRAGHRHARRHPGRHQAPHRRRVRDDGPVAGRHLDARVLDRSDADLLVRRQGRLVPAVGRRQQLGRDPDRDPLLHVGRADLG